MGIVLAFAAGYVLGARADRRELDDVIEALQAIRRSDEFRELLRTLRAHAAYTLREIAGMLEKAEGGPISAMTTQDLIDRVKGLTAQD